MTTLFFPMTGAQCADALGIPEKRCRVFLRELFPDDAPGKGGTWAVTSRMYEQLKWRASR